MTPQKSRKPCVGPNSGVDSVIITALKTTLKVGESVAFTAQCYSQGVPCSGKTYKLIDVSDDQVASVVMSGQHGTVQGISVGTTTIVVAVGIVQSAPKLFTIQPAVIVVPPTPTHYELTVGNLNPLVGETIAITAQLKAGTQNSVIAGKTVTWTKTGAGGAFSASTSLTDSLGRAQIQFTVGTDSAISYVITATDNDFLTGSSAPITLHDSGGGETGESSDFDFGVIEIWSTNGGTIPPNTSIEPDPTTHKLLAGFTVPQNGFSPAVAGVRSLVNPLTAPVIWNLTPNYARLRDKFANVIHQCNVGSGPDDLQIDNLSFGRGDLLTLTAFEIEEL